VVRRERLGQPGLRGRLDRHRPRHRRPVLDRFVAVHRRHPDAGVPRRRGRRVEGLRPHGHPPRRGGAGRPAFVPEADRQHRLGRRGGLCPKSFRQQGRRERRDDRALRDGLSDGHGRRLQRRRLRRLRRDRRGRRHAGHERLALDPRRVLRARPAVLRRADVADPVRRRLRGLPERREGGRGQRPRLARLGFGRHGRACRRCLRRDRPLGQLRRPSRRQQRPRHPRPEPRGGRRRLPRPGRTRRHQGHPEPERRPRARHQPHLRRNVRRARRHRKRPRKRLHRHLVRHRIDHRLPAGRRGRRRGRRVRTGRRQRPAGACPPGRYPQRDRSDPRQLPSGNTLPRAPPGRATSTSWWT